MFYHHDIDNFLVALDQKTGKIVWRTPRKGFTRSYSTPIIAKFGGRTEVIVAGSLQLAGYETSSGKKLWWVNQLSRIVDPTPNLVDGVVYIASQTAGGDAT
jgi:outer membrane protein assembly factor BamB